MSNARWMIYGANGYTGALTARLARSHAQNPVLAGRSAQPLAALAQELEFDYRVFDLGDHHAIARGLEDIAAVVHMAGPFSATSQPMVDACLHTGTHYLDITGEIDVFEAVFARAEAARKAGVVLLPGVGFDVVPTDCLALMLKEQLPDATDLELAFVGSGRPSKGTSKTMIEGMKKGGRVRIAGKITEVPFGWRTREIPFENGARQTVTIPWGDVSTAYRSTGIPNICVYTAVPRRLLRKMAWLNRLAPVLRTNIVQSLLKRYVEKTVKGPTAAQRQSSFTEVWGEVRNQTGQAVVGKMTTPEGYSFTAESALAAVAGVLAGKVQPGAWTPAQAFGADFVKNISGVVIHSITKTEAPPA